jgi:hypothetical protein
MFTTTGVQDNNWVKISDSSKTDKWSTPICHSAGGGDSVMVVEDGWLVTKGNVLAILSLGCFVISKAFIFCRLIFFTYAILAGLNYSCIRAIDFSTPFVVIYLIKHHHHHQSYQ